MGLSNQTDPVELTLVEHAKGDEVDAYERLLTDAMAGERLLFVREDAVDAAWAIVDQVLDNATPYTPTPPARGVPPKPTNSPPASAAGTTPPERGRSSTSLWERAGVRRLGYWIFGSPGKVLVAGRLRPIAQRGYGSEA